MTGTAGESPGGGARRYAQGLTWGGFRRGLSGVVAVGLVNLLWDAYAPVAQSDRASGFEPEGRRFESFPARPFESLEHDGRCQAAPPPSKDPLDGFRGDSSDARLALEAIDYSVTADPKKGPAAVVLVTRPGGWVLGLERGDADWYLPGGKVEPGETARQAAVRELREETGYQVSPGDLKSLCDFMSHTGRPLEAFLVEHPPDAPERFRRTLAGQPAWVRSRALVQSSCTYRAECQRVLDAAFRLRLGRLRRRLAEIGEARRGEVHRG